MSKCLCYGCHFSAIREWKRKSFVNDQIFFGLHIYCDRTKTNIIDEELAEGQEGFVFANMTCNRFKKKSEPIPFKGEISKKLIKEAEEAVKKQKLKDS